MDEHWLAGRADVERHPEPSGLEEPHAAGGRRDGARSHARARHRSKGTQRYEDRRGQTRAFAMPLTSPAFPPGPYRFVDREYLIITYRTDPAALEAVIPEPLTFDEPIVKYEFIRMPDSTGFGDYTESGQVIPVKFNGKRAATRHAMFLNDGPPIYGGRELWGFPKKYAQPSLERRQRHAARHARLWRRCASPPAPWASSTRRSIRAGSRRHGEAELSAQDHPACRRHARASSNWSTTGWKTSS